MGKFVVMDGFKPAGDFTIADSTDIAYSDGKTVKQAIDEQVSVAEQVETNTAAIAQNTTDINTQSGKIETLTGKVTAAETAIAGKASQSDVDVLSDKLDKPYLFIPHLDATFDPCGDCFVFIFKSKATILDLGRYDSYDILKDQLKKKGIEKIDNIIITHWHSDHSGENPEAEYANMYSHWKRDFDLSDVKLYIPREAPSGTDHNDARNGVIASFNASAIVTIDNDTRFEWEGITFTVKNQGDEDYQHYIESSGFNGDLNIFSAIIRAESDSFSFLDLSDTLRGSHRWGMEKGYIENADIWTAPHHGVNPGYTALSQFTPTYIVATNNYAIYDYANPFVGFWMTNAIVFENTRNDEGVVFRFNNGISYRGFTTAINGTDVSMPIYVDETINPHVYQDGSESYPYHSVQQALSVARGRTTIHLMSDITQKFITTYRYGSIRIEGDNHSISSADVGSNSYIVFNQCMINGTVQVQDSNAEFFECTFKKPTIIYRSHVLFYECELNNSALASTCNYSYVIINTVSGSASDYLIDTCYASTVNVANNATGKTVKNQNSIVNESDKGITSRKIKNINNDLIKKQSGQVLNETISLDNNSTYLLIAGHSSGGCHVAAISVYGNTARMATLSQSQYVHVTLEGKTINIMSDYAVGYSFTKIGGTE